MFCRFFTLGKINQFTSSHMRQLVADCIANQPDTYNDAILGRPVKEYCDWIRNTTSWGGAIELAVLSNHFRFEIAVVNSTTGVISRFGEDKGYDKRVFLLFDGIHYDPLYMDFAIVSILFDHYCIMVSFFFQFCCICVRIYIILADGQNSDCFSYC